MKLTYRIIASVVCLAIALSAGAQVRHEVKPGETLYGISNRYGVTINDIQKSNPGLGESLMSGQVIVIPTVQQGAAVTPQQSAAAVTPQQSSAAATPQQSAVTNGGDYVTTADGRVLFDADGRPIPRCKEVYVVKKKDTLFGIARDHGVTLYALFDANPGIDPEKKLKKNTELCIPYTEAEIQAILPPEPVVEEKVYTPVSVGIIMPYGLAEEKKTKDMITMVDFYEGVMLAIRDLKAEGVSANVFAYDEADIDSVLALPQMQNLQVIIGAKSPENIDKLIRFTKRHGMRLVVPMSSNSLIVSNSPHVFQVNCKMESGDYAGAFQSYAEMNPNAHFVFVTINEQLDKSDYVARLKNYLNSHGVAYNDVELKDIAALTDKLAADRDNVLVLSSSTKTAFERVARKLADMELASYRMTMLGYNDWQAFADKEAEAFSKLRCSFFTTFYMNPNATSTHTFNQKFRSAFQREQFSSYPRYGMLGYDIANFFVRHLYWEGEDFDADIENLSTTAYQNPLRFRKKSPASGYVNKAMMFVQYNADGTVSVKQY